VLASMDLTACGCLVKGGGGCERERMLLGPYQVIRRLTAPIKLLQLCAFFILV
jgi:hypothetical protein